MTRIENTTDSAEMYEGSQHCSPTHKEEMANHQGSATMVSVLTSIPTHCQEKITSPRLFSPIYNNKALNLISSQLYYNKKP